MGTMKTKRRILYLLQKYGTQKEEKYSFDVNSDLDRYLTPLHVL